jgi:sarcosine oxidase, subunit gamma
MASPLMDGRSALHGLALVSRPGVVEFTDAGPTARFIYRGGAAVLQRALGVENASRPCYAAVTQAVAALWLGPDEWLLILAPGQAASCRATIASALKGEAGCLVDVSDRNLGLMVVGPRAPETLAGGCPLDLHMSAFPPGMCTRTLIGKAEVVIWRRDAHVFRLEAWRSLAPYLVGLLELCVRGLPSCGTP